MPKVTSKQNKKNKQNSDVRSHNEDENFNLDINANRCQEVIEKERSTKKKLARQLKLKL